MFAIIAALVAVPVSPCGADGFLRSFARLLEVSLACYWSSALVYFSSLTVKFLGELQIRSNWVNTSLIYLMSSLVLGL